MEKVNLPIDPDLGQEIKKHIDAGLVITGMGVVKGWKDQKDSYFISLDIPVMAPVTPPPAAVAAVGTETLANNGAKLKDGDPEQRELKEPFIKPQRQIVVAHSPDPNKPTLADLVDLIIAANKKMGLEGKPLADKCLDEVFNMKDPVTNTNLPTEVQNAMQAYLNQELLK